MPYSVEVATVAQFRLKAAASHEPHLDDHDQTFFEVFRAEEVSMTSTLFSGGDWRWRLRSPAGATLAKGDGYKSERACRIAVMALRGFAVSVSDKHKDDSQ
jgi:uncharacterized protein YegP (UPF0339 family)